MCTYMCVHFWGGCDLWWVQVSHPDEGLLSGYGHYPQTRQTFRYTSAKNQGGIFEVKSSQTQTVVENQESEGGEGGGGYRIALNFRGSKFSRIAIFISRIRSTHMPHATCQKFSLKYFRKRLKIREIKDPQKFCAIRYLYVPCEI